MIGIAKNSTNTVVLYIGSGIGASAVINHQIHRGAFNPAGEIGHICINPTGSMCECGRRGYLQTYIADWAILKDAQAVKPDATLDDVFNSYQSGEAWAVNLIDCVVNYVSITISILANTYAPDEIILCGRLIDKYEILKEIIFENYKSQLNDYLLDSFELKTSEFGSEGTVIGAGTIAFYHLMDEIFEK
ncbi:MAG: ROK family protein [Anaerocolumna sp.]